METDFDNIYARLRPVMEQLEARRRELKAKGNRTGMIAGGIVFLLGLFIGGGDSTCLLVSAVIAGIIWYGCISSKSAPLCAFYKQHVISVLVSQLCENASFQPDKGISEQMFRASRLFSAPDRYHSEDLISGKIDRTAFCCAEIVAEEKRTTTDSKAFSSLPIFKRIFRDKLSFTEIPG